MMTKPGPIGVFDSGYGGLTVLKEFVNKLPQYDYFYLGDNARAPYGSRSFDTVYEYTFECVNRLFAEGCHLVILACNTASAKALRTIQQKDLHRFDSVKRVLGVIRPTTEIVKEYTLTNQVGIFATSGTVSSQSYPIEINKFYPEIKVYQEACPIWVPLVENNEMNNTGADYFIQKHVDALLSKSSEIDAIILGCTHYPILINQLRKFIPENIKIISQGEIVANSLKNYLMRHTDLESLCSKNAQVSFNTTDFPDNFNKGASIFWLDEVKSKHILL
jgi:glutamate racemase